MIIRRLGTRQNSHWTSDWLRQRSTKYCILCYVSTKTYSADSLVVVVVVFFFVVFFFFVLFFAKCLKCICLHLHVPILILSLILSVDSDWLIPIKVLETLTVNRNYFCSHQSWSNFDQVRQSGVYTIKVSQSKSFTQQSSSQNMYRSVVEEPCYFYASSLSVP